MAEKYIDIDGQILRIEKSSFGIKQYFNSNNQIHRLGGPAVEYRDGTYIWAKEGRTHRIGGPASYFTSKSYGDKYYYWINGKKVNTYYICA